ncbi:Gfo/Idh/MocA family oxidoreductase [Marinovum sp.]|uniref:Gfo/Idh/MocA family protein n=1 Tax=Marinovum sp. TaxID=2024839 RepID=UPI002B26AFD5|nr:Gfo/Idh/MocA family oxidoreductase [Marinovum sp.]
MTQSKTLQVALIGAGMVAKTHVAALAEARGVNLRGIASRSGTSAARLAAEATELTGAAVRTYGSVAEIAADGAVDIAVIVTPPDARADLIRPLAAAGKHILLEKPVGRTAAEAREVVAVAEAAGVQLGIVFQHRMRAASQKAAELVASGALGGLGLVEIAVPWWRDQAYYDEPGRGSYARDGGGVLINQAIHTIDLALSLAGPVRRVRAMARTSRFHAMEAEDFVVAGLEFDGGALGSLTASTASFPGRPETLTLHFDRASLHLASGVLQLDWRDGRSERFGETGGTGGTSDPMAFTHAWHQAVIEDFTHAVSTGRAPVCPGGAALPSHDLIEAITRSAQSGAAEELAA